MKFEELHLSPFGYFENLKFDFSDKDRNFHVIYGSNEAGKSTTLRAISGLLYGIPQRSKDGFRFENKNLRIRARIARKAGQSLSLVRRKGTTNTLFDWEGRSLDEISVSDCVSGLSGDLFSSMFGINHEGLASGSNDLLLAKGDMAEILFQAGTGLASVRSMLKSFEDEASGLYSSNARNQSAKLNAAKLRFKVASDYVKQYEVLSKVWLKLQTDLATADKASAEEHEKLDKLVSSRGRLERQREGLPHLIKRNQLIAEIAEIGEIIDLPESATKERESAEQALATAEKLCNRLTNEIATLEEQIAAIDVSAELLSQAENIKALNGELGAILVADGDLAGLESSLAQCVREKKRLLAELGFNDGREPLRPSVVQRMAIRTLTEEYSILSSNKSSQASEISKTAAKLASTRKELEDLPIIDDASALNACLNAARRHIGLDDTISKLKVDLAIQERNLMNEIEHLPLWSGTAAQLERLAIPSAEVIESYARSFADLDNKIAGQFQYLAQIGERLREAEAALLDPHRPTDLPTEQNLIQSRRRRDLGWTIVRQAWKEGLPSDVVNKRFDTQVPLAEAFHKSMLDADHISDQLRIDADQVAADASLQKAKQGLSDERAAATGKLDEFEAQRSLILSDWIGVWQPLGIKPLSVSEMKQWTHQCDAIMVSQTSIEGSKASLKGQEEQQMHLIEQTRAGLAAAGSVIPDGIKNVSILIDLSEQRLTELTALSDKQKELSRVVKECETKATDTERLQAETIAQLAEWQTSWRAEMMQIGLEPETTPSIAGSLLDTVLEYFQVDENEASFQKRIDGIHNRASRFAESATKLIGLIAPDLNGLEVRMAVPEIASRLETMGKANERRTTWLNNLEQSRTSLDQSLTEMEGAEQKLCELTLKAGSILLADLPIAEERSRLARNKRRELDVADQALIQNASTNSFEEWLTELAIIDPDCVDADIAKMADKIGDQTKIVKEKDELIGSLKNEIRQIDGSDRAAEQSETAQQALAEISAAFERYAHVQVARSVLRGFINKYKDENQGPVLAKAKEIFRDLTLGEWTTLQTNYDESDNPILEGVRSDTKAVGVDGMSDGTRDALFLALRLASLHHYFSTHEPIPFIVDDIFINLDDRRAVAAFKALLDLSDKTQVIFFTHHRHLCELAKSALPKERLLLHTLET
jgi:uncharacterized protein YhaN